MKNRRNFAFLKTGIACAVGAALSAPAFAMDFEFGDGWTGNWTSSVSLGASWRTHARDKFLYSDASGHVAGVSGGVGKNTIDEGNVNYGPGDNFTTLLKGFTEVEFKKGSMGGLVRAKAWYDFALKNGTVTLGNQQNGFNGYNLATDHVSGRHSLSDRGLPTLDKYSGVYLLDAYVYDTYNVGGHDLSVRLGNQVVNWGESVFIQGINYINPIDVPSLRKPGTELKEVFLPVPILKAALSLGDVGNLEAFWQIKYQETPIESGCGNYWSVSQGTITAGGPGACSSATPVGTSNPRGVATGMYVHTLDGKRAKDGGEYGVAYRFNAVDTEFGIYAMNLHARIPSVGIVYGDYTKNGSLIPMASKWTDIEDIKVYGLTATTTILGWSVAAELNQFRDYPAQIDGNDLLGAGLYAMPMFGHVPLGPVGPLAMAAYNNFAAGREGAIVGNTPTNKTQFQVNGLQAGTGFLAAQQWVAVAEVGFQWNNLPDYKKDLFALRYNRPFIFGSGPGPTYGGATCAPGDQNSGCNNDGYVSKFAWGYRLLGYLTYNDVGGTGVTVQPKVFFSHDVKGYSVDSQFNEDRKALGLSVKFTYDKKYWLELGQTIYNHKADYDPLRDRDFFSATVGASF